MTTTPTTRLRRRPLRVRLVAAFAAVMLAVLTAAGGFVFWRVQVALDRTLNADLDAQAGTLEQAAARHPENPAATLAELPQDVLAQILDPRGHVLASSGPARALTLLPHDELGDAAFRLINLDPGNLLTSGRRRLRGVALPLLTPPGQPPLIGVTAVRLGQRDEALRELLAQLAIANLLALAAAGAVGYRLARAALLPVERYRSQAAQITAGTPGLRLDVPAGVDDEISRLGHTLNQMLTAQEASARQQRQFLADASHELRTPLTVLTAEIELALRRPRTTQQYQQTLQQMARDTARLATLANQLLDLETASQPSTPQPAGLDPAPTILGAPADLRLAAQRAADHARTRLADTPRSVHVTAPEHALVALAPGTLGQVLANLLDNAIVHGAGNLSIAVTSTGQAVTAAITDEGPGPPTAFIPHAIDRFRRADAARTSPGSGLGLALVHTLASNNHGELRLCVAGQHHRYPPLVHHRVPCTHPDQGTTASIVIPVAEDGSTTALTHS